MSRKKSNIIRFGITDNNGKRAATWTVVNPISKSDIYISCRELGGAIKTSLHESGSWHVGFSKEATEEHFQCDKIKYIEIWDRPEELSPGLSLAIRIITPYSAIKTPIINKNKTIKWIPNCKEGKATEIDFIFTDPHTKVSNWPGKNSMNTELIGSFILPNKETLWLVYWECPIPDFSNLNNGNPIRTSMNEKMGKQTDNLKAIVFGQSEDGSRIILDCAVENKLNKQN